MNFTYNPFGITAPSICLDGIPAVSCVSVNPDIGGKLACQELDPISGGLTWNFTEQDYTSGEIPPGDYVFTYAVTTADTSGIAEVTENFTVTVTLVDPCLNVMVSVPDLSMVEFTITESDQTLPPFSVDPSFCATGVQITTGTIPGVPITTDPGSNTITIPQVSDSLDPANPNGNPG